jgi:hypothetical protein
MMWGALTFAGSALIAYACLSAFVQGNIDLGLLGIGTWLCVAAIHLRLDGAWWT